MQVKILEVRDRATFIPVMATLLERECKAQRRLLSAAGYGGAITYVIVTKLDGTISQYAPHAWGGRTMPNAHSYILHHWDELVDGDVIDIEYILGETATKKEPQ